MDVVIEQIGCDDLAERTIVHVLSSISSKIYKEVLPKEECTNYIIMSSKYVNFAGHDDCVKFIDDRSFVINIPSLLEHYKDGTYPWTVFETSGLTIIGNGIIIRKNKNDTLVKQCFRIEINNKYDYGYFQLYSTVSCEYNRKFYPRRSLLTFFLFKNYCTYRDVVFPPFQSLKLHNCQTYIPMLPGQGLQIITPVGIVVKEKGGCMSFLRSEQRRVLHDKETMSVHRFVCRRKPEYNNNEILQVCNEGPYAESFCPVIIPGIIRELKDALFPIIMEPHDRVIVAGANIKGFIVKKVSEEKIPWVFTADSFIVLDNKDEVKVKFTGNPSYVIMQKINGCWLLCESSQIVECI